ncbi:unnamed protein product [Echinostoma caproni]|uniref:Protein SMG8 n=1 Tax=Echinostoma caproni TaxID=27848 RepID=A0A183BB91_9TREM|nr:unnamed protein product [Echinostoma caproni]
MVSSGAQDEVRFSCPRTGLTVFRGVLVQVEQPKARSKKNRKSTEKGQSGRIEAVFLVPFGQNNNRAFQLPARRQNLCRMLNVSSLLLIFSNPRYFHSDLDSIKSALSGVLGAFHLGRADGGNAPILSTPDGYTRNKLELSTSTSKQREILTDCVQFRLSDLDQLLNLKRLVLPHADLRPVLATNASSLRVPSVMGPRGLHAQAWVEMLSLPTGCSRVACYGLPPIGPFSSERSRHFQIHLAGANPGCEVSIQEAFNALYTEESGTTVCLQCGIPLITWPAMCSEDQGKCFGPVNQKPISIPFS